MADVRTEQDGFVLKWHRGRSDIECNVYQGDKLLEELGYPKLPGMTLEEAADAFTAEAALITQRNLEKGDT